MATRPPGAVAAQLNRSRARLRVEYLLALQDEEPPTDRCRPVLFALSIGDRRRQRELDSARHLRECDLCASLSQPLTQRIEDPCDLRTCLRCEHVARSSR